MRVYARMLEYMFVYAFIHYMHIQNKYKLCFYTFLLTLLLILMYNFNFDKYAFMLVLSSLYIQKLTASFTCNRCVSVQSIQR